MTNPISAADEAVLQRRGFLRGSALLAAAAGGVVAATAGSVLPASADTSSDSSVTIAVPPTRIFDTRTSDGRSAIMDSSNNALDSKYRLRPDAWVDVAVASAVDDSSLDLYAIFVNLGTRDSTKAGSLIVSEPGDRPSGYTLTFVKGQRATNSAIVGLGFIDDYYVVRIFATVTSHVALDVTGASIYTGDYSEQVQRSATRTNSARVQKAVRAARR